MKLKIAKNQFLSLLSSITHTHIHTHIHIESIHLPTLLSTQCLKKKTEKEGSEIRGGGLPR